MAAKKVITAFIDKEMGQNDQAAIASATGQIGFLQQLTNDRIMLKLALDRLTPEIVFRARFRSSANDRVRSIANRSTRSRRIRILCN